MRKSFFAWMSLFFCSLAQANQGAWLLESESNLIILDCSVTFKLREPEILWRDCSSTNQEKIKSLLRWDSEKQPPGLYVRVRGSFVTDRSHLRVENGNLEFWVQGSFINGSDAIIESTENILIKTRCDENWFGLTHVM